MLATIKCPLICNLICVVSFYWVRSVCPYLFLAIAYFIHLVEDTYDSLQNELRSIAIVPYLSYDTPKFVSNRRNSIIKTAIGSAARNRPDKIAALKL